VNEEVSRDMTGEADGINHERTVINNDFDKILHNA